MAEDCIPVQCCVCIQRGVFGRCIDCSEYFCIFCCAGHTSGASNAAHTIVPIIEEGTTRMNKTCLNHRSQTLEVLCECDLERPLCMICFQTEHQPLKHKFVGVKDTAKEIMDKLHEMLEADTMKERSTVLERSIKNLKMYNDGLSYRFEEERTAMHNHYEILAAELSNALSEGEDELARRYHSYRGQIGDILARYQKEHDEHQALIKNMRYYLEQSSPTEIVLNRCLNEKVLRKEMTKITLLHNENRPTGNLFDYIPSNQIKQEVNRIFGHVTSFQVEPKLYKRFGMKPGDSVHGIAPIGNGQAWISMKGYATLHLVDARIDDAADDSDDRVRYFDVGSVCDTIASDHFGNCIASCPDNKSVVVVNKTMGKVTQLKQFQNYFPHGIAFVTRDGTHECFVTCTLNRKAYGDRGFGTVKRFRYLDKLDDEVIHFSLEEIMTFPFATPDRVAVDFSSDLICVCGYLSGVSLSTAEGTVIKYDGNLKPKGICFDKDGCVVIANYGGKELLRMDKNGYIQTLFIEKRTSTVAVDMDDILWVGLGYGEVEMYELHFTSI